MTICLAAIGKEGSNEIIVFATDHMVTTAMGQFEHSIVKYKLLNRNTVAMLAGNPLLFNDLVKLKNKNASFDEIKNEIFENFKSKRKEIIQNQVFDAYYIDENFFKQVLSSPAPNPLVSVILGELSKLRLGTGILVIGFDKEHNARIAEINENGVADFRDLNFHAIGSGNVQASNTILFQKYDKTEDIKSTLYTVYKAKRNAEVLQGVGKETELLILRKSGCSKIDKENIITLGEIYDEELYLGKRHSKLSKLKLTGGEICQ